MKREKLGQMLIQRGVLDDYRLRTALGEQKKWGGTLGNTLLRLDYCTPQQLLKALADQQELPAVNLDNVSPDDEALACINRKCAEQNRVVPLRLEGVRSEVLVIAMPAPVTLSVLDDIRSVSGKQRIAPMVALDEAIARAIERFYGEGAVPNANTPSPLGNMVVQPTRAFQPTVYIFGCDDATTARGIELLLKAQVPSVHATELDVISSHPRDVVLAPPERLEALLKAGEEIPCQRVVVSATPQADLERARALKARGLLALPLDPVKLNQMVTKLCTLEGTVAVQSS